MHKNAVLDLDTAEPCEQSAAQCGPTGECWVGAAACSAAVCEGETEQMEQNQGAVWGEMPLAGLSVFAIIPLQGTWRKLLPKACGEPVHSCMKGLGSIMRECPGVGCYFSN